MKKIIIAMMVVLAIFAGMACSGSDDSNKTGWSDAEKASLLIELSVLRAKYNLTTSQTSCVSDWLQEHYASRDEANAAGSAALDTLLEACP